MQIEMAGGGHHGVTDLMAVGHDLEPSPDYHGKLVFAGTALWGYAEFTGRKKLALFAFGGTMAAWLLQMIHKR